jgi:hypothetical protein
VISAGKPIMTVLNHFLTQRRTARRIAIWIWLSCLIAGSVVVVLADAPQIIDQYSASHDGGSKDGG